MQMTTASHGRQVIEYKWPHGIMPSFMEVTPQGLLVRDFARQLEDELGLTALNRRLGKHGCPTTIVVTKARAPHRKLPGEKRLLPGQLVQVHRHYVGHPLLHTASKCAGGEEADDDEADDSVHRMAVVTAAQGKVAWMLRSTGGGGPSLGVPQCCSMEEWVESGARTLCKSAHVISTDVLPLAHEMTVVHDAPHAGINLRLVAAVLLLQVDEVHEKAKAEMRKTES